MKVRISFTVDVDPDAWVEEYGWSSEAALSDIRADVQEHARDSILGQFDSLGLLARGA